MLRLITVILLGAFSLVYMMSIVPKSLGPVWKAIDLLKKNLNYLGLISVIYAAVTVFFTPFLNDHDSDLVVDLLAHVMLIIMALPYIINFIEEKAKNVLPSAIIGEIRKGFVDWILQREKTIGIVGGVISFLLFLCIAGMFNFEIVSAPTIPPPQ